MTYTLSKHVIITHSPLTIDHPDEHNDIRNSDGHILELRNTFRVSALSKNPKKIISNV